MKTLSIAAVLSVLVLSARVSAQVGSPDISNAHHVGRLYLKPAIALTNLGVDTNVFNEADQTQPESDFTLTVTPQTDLWLKMGHAWLTGNLKEELVWYQTFASERSANPHAMVGLTVPLNRVRFGVNAAYLNTRERPGFEIDSRSQRRELSYHGSVDVRLRPKTFVGLRGDRMTTGFDSAALFEGVNLREALNRTVTSAAVTVRQQLTPLTAMTLDVGRGEDRFEFSPLRDSDSTSASLGVTFDSIIKGRASFGYRDLQPLSLSLPPYQGTTAAADLSYVAFGTTRLGVQATREIQYSFETIQPYYLLTGVTGSVMRRIARPVDVVGRAGVQNLNYRDSIGIVVAARNRIDTVHTYGGGIGYHLGKDVRVGFNVDYARRASPVLTREYHGFLIGTSVTYGL